MKQQGKPTTPVVACRAFTLPVRKRRFAGLLVSDRRAREKDSRLISTCATALREWESTMSLLDASSSPLLLSSPPPHAQELVHGGRWIRHRHAQERRLAMGEIISSLSVKKKEVSR
jgi:hypothetical protein